MICGVFYTTKQLNKHFPDAKKRPAIKKRLCWKGRRGVLVDSKHVDLQVFLMFLCFSLDPVKLKIDGPCIFATVSPCFS